MEGLKNGWKVLKIRWRALEKVRPDFGQLHYRKN